MKVIKGERERRGEKEVGRDKGDKRKEREIGMKRERERERFL